MNAQQLFAANLGKKVETAAGQMTIESLLDKMGTLKSGEKAPYMHLVGDSGIVDLHPEKAKQLLTKGECGSMRILADIAAEPVAVVATASEDFSVQSETDTTGTPALATTEAAGEQGTADATDKPAVAVAPKKETNKEGAMRIYNELNVDGKQRKEIIARFRTELGMGVPGSNTYYQNIKSKMWK